MRWWWFTKALKGTSSWTARCPRCKNGCAIVVTKEFSRASKAWTIAAVMGIYLAVFGMMFTMADRRADDDSVNLPGLAVGIAGLSICVISLVGALVNDVLRSRVQLTAAVICTQCGERLPDDFDSDTCPVCGAELAATPVFSNRLPPEILD
jgi:uncharacterized paraquat-inducible protein A